MSSSDSVEWVDGPDNISFFTKRWTPAGTPKAHVVFVHGFVEYIERYDYYFSQFAERGISVFAFDQRGFGKTGQKTGTLGATTGAKQLSDMEFFLAKEEKRLQGHNSKIFLYGHSMGGALALTYACLEDPSRPTLARLSGLISSSPLISQLPHEKASSALLFVGGLIGKVLPSLQMKVAALDHALTHDEALNESYKNDPLCAPIGTYRGISDMLNSGQALLDKNYRSYPASLPLLVFHGNEDQVTWHDASQQFVEKVKANDKQFISLPGYYHEAHNEPGEMKERVINDVTGWILKHV